MIEGVCRGRVGGVSGVGQEEEAEHSESTARICQITVFMNVF